MIDRMLGLRRQMAAILGTVMLLVVSILPVGAAPQATPAASDGSSALLDMAALVPVQAASLEDPERLEIYYTDIAAQLDAVGVSPPESQDAPEMDGWVDATRSMQTLPPDATMNLFNWRDDFGFDLLQADQTMYVASLPFSLSILRGRFDSDAILQRMSEVGYQEVEVDGHKLLSVRDDFEVELDAPTSYKMAHMNFGTILEDGTLVFGSSGDAVAAVLDVIAGVAPSMMDVAGYAKLLDHAPTDLVSALFMPGSMLMGGDPTDVLFDDSLEDQDAQVDTLATQAAELAEMPPLVMGMIGATAGTEDARAVAVTLTLSPEAADMAARVMDERLSTGSSNMTEQPYASMFDSWVIEVMPDSPGVRLVLDPAEDRPAGIIYQMLFARDLGFLAW